MYINITYVYSLRHEKRGEVIKKISKFDNHLYLIQGNTDFDKTFPCLCQIEPDDSTCFGPEDMEQLIKELGLAKRGLSDPKNLAHIDEIIDMAEECKKTPKTAIIFD